MNMGVTKDREEAYKQALALAAKNGRPAYILHDPQTDTYEVLEWNPPGNLWDEGRVTEISPQLAKAHFDKERAEWREEHLSDEARAREKAARFTGQFDPNSIPTPLIDAVAHNGKHAQELANKNGRAYALVSAELYLVSSNCGICTWGGISCIQGFIK